jgi:hypothetical protein
MTDASPTIPDRDHAQRSFAVPCPSCKAWTERQVGPHGSSLPPSLSCSSCGTPQRLELAEHLDEHGHLDGCPCCGYHTLCIQKDVNPKLGVAVVVVSFGTLLLLQLSVPQLVAGLLGLAVVDALLLRLVVKRFLICYRCKAQYRGFPPGPRCRPFDLSTWEAHDAPADEAT